MNFFNANNNSFSALNLKMSGASYDFSTKIGTFFGDISYKLSDENFVRINPNNTVSTILSLTGNKEVDFYIGSPDKVNTINLSNLSSSGNLYSTVNLSKFNSLTSLTLTDHPYLDNIIFPENSYANFSYLSISGTNLYNINLEGLHNLSGIINLDETPNLSSIIFPNTQNLITFLSLSSYHGMISRPNLTELDFSPMPNLSGVLYVVNSPALSSITFSSQENNNAFTNFIIRNNAIIESLDISKIKGLGGIVELHLNTRLNEIIFPDASETITTLNCQGSDLKDIYLPSTLTIGGVINFNSNTGLTSVTITLSETTSYFDVGHCDLHTLDFSITTSNMLSGEVKFNGNANLGSIIFPPSNRVINKILGDSNGSLTNINLPFTKAEGLITFSFCSGLTSVTLPATNGIFTEIIFDNCNLDNFNISPLSGTQPNITFRLNNNNFAFTEIDSILNQLDIKGWTNGIVDLSGEGNEDPGNDGKASKTSLEAKGWTVSTNNT